MIIDSSPGTGCPVIAGLQDTNYVILITEPTPSALSDLRRVLEKAHTARAYYAYSLNPYTALITDKELFSPIVPIHYNLVFKDRKIQDLIIPHIFMEMLI